jgi:hypothetical protein
MDRYANGLYLATTGEYVPLLERVDERFHTRVRRCSTSDPSSAPGWDHYLCRPSRRTSGVDHIDRDGRRVARDCAVLRGFVRAVLQDTDRRLNDGFKAFVGGRGSGS